MNKHQRLASQWMDKVQGQYPTYYRFRGESPVWLVKIPIVLFEDVEIEFTIPGVMNHFTENELLLELLK